MDCREAASFVSALYDGEHVPKEFANHIDSCGTCREALRSYSQIGAELRLMASQTNPAAVLPPSILERVRAAQGPARFSFLKARVLVPRFALITAGLALIAVSTSLVAVRAQSRAHPMWFEFELLPRGNQAPDGHLRVNVVAQAGYDDQIAWIGPVLAADHQPESNRMQAVGSHIKVSSIKEGQVELAIRSRRYAPGDPGIYKVKGALSNLNGHTFTYRPGEELEIPVEGGGTLILRGEITDTQPKLSLGLPVEPKADQIVLTNPVVIRDQEVVSNMEGGGTLAEGGTAAAFITSAEMGRLIIALQPFAGAIPTQATWGKIKFALNGHHYMVFSASPICGGGQPHAVWVAVDSNASGLNGNPARIGTLPQSALAR